MSTHKLPNGWVTRKLGECFALTSGSTKPSDFSEEAFSERAIPVYGGNGIMGYTAVAMTDENRRLIIGRVGEKCGCVCKVDSAHWVTDNALYSREWKIEADLDFFCYLLDGAKLNRYRNKGGQPLISQQVIYSLKFSIPPLSEQEAIASVLCVWDRGIALTEQQIAEKRLRRKGLMQKLLTGKRRLPGFGGKWREVSLGNIFHNRTESARLDLPLVSIAGDRGIIPRDEIDRKDSSNEDKSKYLRICPGDIGYNTMRMWQGVSGLSAIEGIVSPAYTILTPKQGIDGEFMAILFKFQPVVHLFYRHSQGMVSDTWNLKFRHFAKIKVTIPSEDEQKAIAMIFRTLDRELELLQAKADALRKQKTGLMQQLLTGKMRVKV